MDLLSIITLLIVLSAFFGYINMRFIKLPQVIGLMLMSLFFSLAMLTLNYFSHAVFQMAEKIVNQIDFSEVLLNVMLSFLLFAGALHTDTRLLRKNWRSIVIFSLVGVVLSTFAVSALLFYGLQLIGQPINYIYCLLFGALISPTDPIAVLGILTKSGVPKRLEINIVGESLFNDGVGVVVFLVILQIIRGAPGQLHAFDIALLFSQEAGGGLLLGFVIGYTMFLLIRSINDYQTEVIITIAGVMGGNLLANYLHVSAPLAMVVAGLYTGSRAKDQAMSHNAKQYIGKFWELIDVLMNAILFVLIGLRLMVLDFSGNYLVIGLMAIPIILFSRYLSLRVPLLVFRKSREFDTRSILLMTWGGLRGGLSIAMALSLTRTEPKELIVCVTYIVVLFSIIVQGLTIGKLAKKLYQPTGATLSVEGVLQNG